MSQVVAPLDKTDNPAVSSESNFGRSLAILIVIIGCLYTATATWSPLYNPDVLTIMMQARSFADDQSPILEEAAAFTEPEFQGRVGWFVESPQGPTAQYAPGTAAWGSLFYLADTSTESRVLRWSRGEAEIEVPQRPPAVIAAITSVLVALIFFALTLRPVVSERRALQATALAGLGTGAWSVAADRLWQHGPGMMCLSAAMYCTSRHRLLLAGVAFGGAILIRPHTAIFAACVGIGCGISERSMRPIVSIGATSALGLALLMSYNNAVFGSYSISGGYGTVFGDRMLSEPFSTVFARLLQSFIDADVGMLWTSPFLLFGIFGVLVSRPSAPGWAWGGAAGAFAYLFVQYRVNRVSGGDGFFGYRYPLEALMAAGPLLALGAVSWCDKAKRNKQIFFVAAGLSVIAHGLGSM